MTVIKESYEIQPTTLALHPCQIYCMAATKNMKWVFTGGDDGFIRKFDLEQTFKLNTPLSNNQKHGFVDSIVKSATLVSAWENEEISQVGVEYIKKYSAVTSLDCHSQGVWLVSGTMGGKINLYTVRHDEGSCQHIFKGHSKAVSCLKVFNDGKSLISGSWDKSVYIWDLNTGAEIKKLDDLPSQITSISIQNSNKSTFLISTFDGTLFVYDSKSGTMVSKIQIPDVPPWCMSSTWSIDDQYIYAGRRNALVNEIDWRQAKNVRDFKNPKDSGPVSAVYSLSNHLISGSFDNIRLWNLDSEIDLTQEDILAPFSIIPGHHGGTISSILINENETFMLSASGSRGYNGTSNNHCILYNVQKKEFMN